MTTPEIFLAVLLTIAIVGLADAIWRSWRGRPRPFRFWPDVFGYALFIFVSLQLHATAERDLIAKGVLVVAVVALFAVNLISHKRRAAVS